MDLTTLTYIVVGLSFALYIGIAIWAKASTTGEFYVAGKGVNPVVNGMATAADWMSAASFISMAGLIAFLGYGGSVYLMGWTGGYCLLAMLLAPYLRKYGKFTVPEFIGDRYYSKAARIVAVICLIFISFTYVAGQMRGVGIVFSRFLEVEILTGLIVGMGIVFIYAVLGGMKGITYTQVAQYCVLIIAYTIPAIFIAFQLTGNPLPQLAFGSTVNGTGDYMLDRLNQIVTELGFLEYTTTSKSTIDIFCITLALMVGTAGLPHVIVRFFTVPKVRDARSSAGWALVFIAILYTTAPAVGAMARLNLTETVQIGAVGDPEGNLKVEDRPDWMSRWEATGLLKFEDKNGDGRIQYYNDANKDFAAKAAEYGWAGNELKVDNDIMVLANPEIAQLPNWVIALVAAGGIAAALSTAAGLLLVISSGISHDLLKGTLTPDMTEGQELMAGRIAAAVAILIAGYLGYNPPGFVAQVVAFAFGLAAASLFPVIIMGIFSKKVNREGAIAGMLVGLVFTMGYIMSYKGIFIPVLIENVPANWLFGISPEGIGVVGMILNFLVAFGVSKVTAEPPAHIQHMIEDIRVPKGAGGAVDH
ncbi:cation acetate symporter [Thalassospira lucentensis]|uniref:Cation/acetate symporter n=3 Tax=Thalassospira TaxID=168934 RepID=A0A154KQ81_9PROT|nr:MULTISPECIES: sodium:solute symporter family protein [Thalassospira]KZB51707.1 cation acetate symporter [Thalassospira xiamenensis]KZB69493.1 cation acetate symporter [Thalassospira lucentensis]MCH2276860.1 cation acetate symporter [Thalassospira sp.]MCK2167564.1 cation acetate symporter [Thalassospira xiamenensis]RCK03856.1 sodium:solute symporter [Thalassospira xianhensis MCCC 1A02616]